MRSPYGECLECAAPLTEWDSVFCHWCTENHTEKYLTEQFEQECARAACEEVCITNIEKLKKRFPDGFSQEAAQAKADEK